MTEINGIIGYDNDPWTFTDTIRVYNWESHPDWDKCALMNPTKYPFTIQYYKNKYPKLSSIIEAKRILANYNCIKWDSILKKDIFRPSDEWKNNMFFPIKLSTDRKNSYNIDYPEYPSILTHSVIVPHNKSYINVYGTWKIYYSGGSDTGSLYINSIVRFKKDIDNCNVSQLIYFPSVYINKPLLFCEKNDDEYIT